MRALRAMSAMRKKQTSIERTWPGATGTYPVWGGTPRGLGVTVYLNCILGCWKFSFCVTLVCPKDWVFRTR